MANQFTGGLELIGVRAIIADLNKYITGARQIELANQQIMASTLRVEQAAKRASETQIKASVSSAKALADQAKVQAAILATQVTPSGQVRRTDTKVYTELLKKQDAAQIIANKSTREAARDMATAERAAGRLALAELELNRANSRLDFSKFSQLKAGLFIAAAAGVAALTAGFIASVNAAAKFQDVITKIDTLTETTSIGAQKLGKDILEMARSFPKSPEELGTSLYFILSSGIQDLTEAQKINTQATKAAVAGFANTTDVAKVVTGIINAYGKENITAAQTTDILLASVQAGRAEFDDFAVQLGRITPIAAALGITLDQTSAALAALTNNGLPAAQAGTALLGVLNQLFSPAEEAKQSLIDVGTSIEELRANVREKGLVPALQDLIRLFHGNQQAIEELFPEVRGLGGALILLANNSEQYNRIQKQVINSVGLTEKEFAIANRTFHNQAQILKNELNIVLITLGAAVLPLLTKSIGAVISVSKVLISVFKDIGKQVFSFVIVPINGLIRIASIVADVVRVISRLFHGEWSEAWTIFKDAAIEALNSIGSVAESVLNSVIGRVNDAIGVLNKIKPGGDIGKVGEVDLTIGGGGGGRGEEAKLAAQEIKKLNAQYADQSLKASELQKEQKKLNSTLVDSINEVSKFESKFGDAFIELPQKLVESLKFDAITTGGVEAFINLAAAEKRAQAEAFNLTRTLATVATTFAQSARAGRELVLNIARNTLESSQAAASSLFARPSKEVANLELILARVTQAHRELRPAIESSIRSYQRDADAHNDAADQIADSTRRLVEGLRDRITSIQESAEGPREQIQNRIDLLQKQARAIKGTTDADERHRTAIENQIEKLRDQADASAKATDKQIRALEKQAAATEKEGKAREEEERSRAGLAKNAAEAEQRRLEQLDLEEERISHHIELLQGENDILEKQLVSADKTLLSQQNLRDFTKILTEQISISSGYVRELSNLLAKNLIPEIDNSSRDFGILRETINILNDEDFRQKFMPGVEAAALAAFAMAGKLTSAAVAAQKLEKELQAVTAANETQGFSHGGIIAHEQRIRVSEFNKPEAVLPLTNIPRSREIIASLPPGLVNAITSRQQAGGMPPITITATGDSLETLQAMVNRAVNKAFSYAQSQSHRAGALLASGLG